MKSERVKKLETMWAATGLRDEALRQAYEWAKTDVISKAEFIEFANFLANSVPTPVTQLLVMVSNDFETAGCEDAGTVSTGVINRIRRHLGWEELDDGIGS